MVADFGFDACIDYKNDDVAAALKQHCPRRVDVYFDNVGGPILDAVLGRLAPAPGWCCAASSPAT